MPKSTTKTRPAKVSVKANAKPYNVKKRKAPPSKPTPTSSTPVTETDADGELAAKKAKKPKNKKKAQRSEEEESLFDLENGINTAFAFMDPGLMADYLAQKLDWTGNELSSIELADLSIRGQLFPELLFMVPDSSKKAQNGSNLCFSDAIKGLAVRAEQLHYGYEME